MIPGDAAIKGMNKWEAVLTHRMELMGSVCLVTGASRGIGNAIARSVSQAGASVAVHYNKSEEEARHLVEEITAQGCRAITVQGDVAIAADVQRIFQHIEEHLGAVDLLVNNAGVSLRALITETSEQQWDRVMAVNVKGAFLCCRRALPAMITKKYGRIVNIASVQGLCGASMESAYAASKGALIALSRSLACEVGPSGITVNAIAPGPIVTEMLTRELELADLHNLADMIPTGRLGSPQEVAYACLMLLSRQASYINGATVNMDGGWKA